LPKNFLVVEDNAEDAALITRAFKATAGSQAFVCRNLSEAKAYLVGAGMYQHREKYPFAHGIICDMHIGNESAVDFLKWRTESEELRALPFIVLTGTASTQESISAEEMGALEVLLKPGKYEDLRQLLRDLSDKLFKEETL
jgi:CheY-like chemotaxis protein